ncbi:hypothetical protein FOZ62_026806 [Perkinsus olseni]|uniref:Uncharacterized protein n=1 Tax=Perkinsus olseni TaxID=32597 RepID=A0A7J6PZF0_PEROL|nr:hypothetical protein FOZ62_026806 [Perkinsus olseni]
MMHSPSLLLSLLLILSLQSILPVSAGRGGRRRRKMGDQGGIDQQPPLMDPSRRGGGMNIGGAPRRRQQQQPGEGRSTNERSPGYSSSDGLGSRRGNADEDDVGQDDLFMPTDVPEPDDPAAKDIPAFTTGRFKNHQRKTLKEQAKHLQSSLITQMENAHSDPDAGEWLLEDELCGGKGCTDPHGTASLRGADNSLVYSSKIDWKAKHLDEKACCITKAEFYVKHTHLFTRCTECDDDGHIVDRGDDWKAEAQHKGSSEYGNNKRKQGYAQPDGDGGLTRRGYENKQARGTEAYDEGREGGADVGGAAVEQRKEGDEEVEREMPGPFDKSADRISEGSEVPDTRGGKSEEAGPFDRSANIGGGSSEGEEGKVAGTFDRARDKLPETKVQSRGERRVAGGQQGGGDEGNDAGKRTNKGKKQQPDPTSKRQMKKAARKAQKAAATKAKEQGAKGNSTPGEPQQPTREEEKRAEMETSGRQQADPTSKRQMKRAAKKAERKARKEAAKNSNKKNGKK